MIMPVQELEGQLAQVTAHKEAAVQELATAMRAAQVEAIATVEDVWAAEPPASGGWPSLLPLPKLAWPAVSLANSPGLHQLQPRAGPHAGRPTSLPHGHVVLER